MVSCYKNSVVSKEIFMRLSSRRFNERYWLNISDLLENTVMFNEGINHVKCSSPEKVTIIIVYLLFLLCSQLFIITFNLVHDCKMRQSHVLICKLSNTVVYILVSSNNILFFIFQRFRVTGIA